MWKRKEDEYTTPSEPSLHRFAIDPGHAGATASGRPRAQRLLCGSSEVATIGKSVVVKGELSGSEDLIVDGEVEGSITLRGQSLDHRPQWPGARQHRSPQRDRARPRGWQYPCH